MNTMKKEISDEEIVNRLVEKVRLNSTLNEIPVSDRKKDLFWGTGAKDDIFDADPCTLRAIPFKV